MVQISYPGVAGFGMFCAKANEDEVSYFWCALLLVPLPFLAKVRHSSESLSILAYSIQYYSGSVRFKNPTKVS